MKSLYRKAVIGSVITTSIMCSGFTKNVEVDFTDGSINNDVDIIITPGEFIGKQGKSISVDKDFSIDIPIRWDSQRGYHIQEFDMNYKVAKEVVKYLEARRINVKLQIANDKSEDLNSRGKIAKSYSPKIYLSIHHNYIDNPNVEGYLMMYNEGDKLSEYYAKELSNALTDSPMLTKQRQDIVNTGNIGELNESPANVNILAELEFFSNKEAIKKAMTDEQIEFLAETIGNQMIKTLNEVK